MAHVGGTLFFGADNGVGRRCEIGRIDGTVLVKDIDPFGSSPFSVDVVANVSGTLFFVAGTN